MSGSLRLFIGLDLPPDWRAALQARERELAALAPDGYRWVAPHSYHLTLAFLGQQPGDRLPAIVAALERAGAERPAFRLRAEGLGAFANGGVPQVIWAGVSDLPPGALEDLQRTVVAALNQQGVDFEPGRFVPHITLGRVRRGLPAHLSRALGQALAEAPRWTPRLAACREVVLFQSRLRPDGAAYTALARAQLRGIIHRPTA